MSVTASRSVVLACSLVVALTLTVSPAAAQDETDAGAVSTDLQRSTGTTSSQRARRAWVPPLRLRSIAPMSELAPDPAADGPATTNPRWFEHREVAPPAVDRLAVWVDRLVTPPALPCADEEPSGEIDCRAPTTVAVAELP